jgi:hypothetical protein
MKNNLDYLSIIHFVQYYFIAKLIPHQYWIIFFISVLWEIFEKWFALTDFGKNVFAKYWFIPYDDWNENRHNSLIDICMNMLGYYFGSN